MISRTTPLAGAYVLAALLVGCAIGSAQEAADFADIRLPGRSFVNNGGFERGTEGWDYFGGRRHGSVVTDEAHTGERCLKVTGVAGDYRYLNQAPVPLVPGREYTLSAWMKSQGFARAGANSQVLNLHNYGWTKGVSITPGKPDEDWTFHSVTFIAPPTSDTGGRPSYTVCVFWPIKSEGTVWIDDIQIEEGPQATGFTESYVGWGLESRETLVRARRQADAVRASLAKGVSGTTTPAALTRRVEEVLAGIAELAGQLERFAELPVEAARALPEQALALAGDVARLGSIAFISDPYRPLSEIALPDREPEEFLIPMHCLHGEKRAVALCIANLGPDSSVARVVAGVLTDLGREVRLPGTDWVSVYWAPQLRGHLRPWERFTDPLPRLDEAGTWALAAGQISQIVLVVDTAQLQPGTYRGEVTIASVTEQAPARSLWFDLRVAPARLAPLGDARVCDVGVMADYALDSIQPLGVNTFSVPAQWLAPEISGAAGEITVDFTRIEPLVRGFLERCPGAHFWLGFGAGTMASAHLQSLRALPPGSPELARSLGEWTRAVVRGFGELGVSPGRLIIETVDEPGPGQREGASTFAEAIKSAEPLVRTQTYVTSFHPDDDACRRMYQAHDIIGLAYTSVGDESVAYLRGLGKQIWVYDCQNNAETFHPVSYYRLLPWLARRHGLDGWGHFSLLNSERGRGYEPWEGVAEQALIYPATGGGQVISRRWLALEAGTQDYRVMRSLDALAKAARDRAVGADIPQRATQRLEDASQLAAGLVRPGREYFTGLAPGAEPWALDDFRNEAADLAGALADALAQGQPPLQGTLEAQGAASSLVLSLPDSGELTLRALCDHRLPWRTVTVPVSQGENRVELPCPEGARVSRCTFQFTDQRGVITTGACQPLPRIAVDSSIEPYSPDRLNDGLAMPGMKFEPQWGWISGGSATEHWVAAELDAPAAIRGVRVWWMTFYGPPLAYRVQARVNGDWQDLPGSEDWRAAAGPVEEIVFPPTVTDAVRVVQKPGGGNARFPNLMGMSEIELRIQ